MKGYASPCVILLDSLGPCPLFRGSEFFRLFIKLRLEKNDTLESKIRPEFLEERDGQMWIAEHALPQ